MDRRDFLKSVAASTAALHSFVGHAEPVKGSAPSQAGSQGVQPASPALVDGHTMMCHFACGKEA